MKLEKAKQILNYYLEKEEFDNAGDFLKSIDILLKELENSISKDKIKEKLNKKNEEYNKTVNQTGELIDNLIDFQRISAKIEILQDLLGDDKNDK